MSRLLRWLIRLYPEDFRRAHERDLLSLYELSGEGPRRAPRVRDVFDLLTGVAGVWVDRMTTHRNGWRRDMMGNVASDIRYATRGLLKSPGFTAMAVLTLALGLGANAAIFSVVNGVLLRSLPYEDSEELVAIFTRFLPVSGFDFATFSVDPTEYSDYRDTNRSMEGVAAHYGTNLTITGPEGDAQRTLALVTTWTLFDVLEAEAAMGRTLTEDDDVPGGPFTVVLSHEFWNARFGADPNIVGKTLTLNGNVADIVGVMPVGFSYPSPGYDMWTTLQLDPQNLGTRQQHYLNMVGRLRDNVTLEAAEQDMSRLMITWEQDYPDIHTGHFMLLEPLLLNRVQTVRTALLLLMGAVGFVLLVVCVNMANLTLVRGQSRLKELAIRRALGARRWRIIQLNLTESLVLAAVGGALGLLLATAGIKALLALQSGSLPRTEGIELNGTVILFTAVLALGTALLFGLVPALQGMGTETAEHMREEGRSGTSGLGRLRLRSMLVTAEVALSILLVVGAGLVTKSFWILLQEDPGFEPNGALVAYLSLPSAAYPTADEATLFFGELIDRLEAVPGVESVTTTNRVPMTSSLSVNDFEVEGLPEPGPGAPTWNAAVSTVRANYFETMGLRLMRGRFFDQTDRPESAPSMVISQSLADKFFQGLDPIGMRMAFSGDTLWFNIVGVVSNVDQASLGNEGNPIYYFAYQQVPGFVASLGTFRARSAALIIRTSTEPLSIVPAVRSLVAEMDPNIPLTGVRTLEDVVAKSVAQPRFIMTLMAIFASLSLLLGAVGIYGVTSFVVSQRGHEIGIRKALGARAEEVVGLIMLQGMVPIAAGLVLGLLGAAAGGRIMQSLLFEVDAQDPFTYAVVAGVLALVGLGASWVPARRAAKIDPMRALRSE